MRPSPPPPWRGHLPGDRRRLLKAQARLGRRDPATTLRHYSHAILLDDTDVADELDRLLNQLAQSTDHSE